MWDVFISHASEDKEDVVDELAIRLMKYEISVWYDGFELKLGDSLSRTIDKGLGNSRYGLIVLSPSFFAKKWPDYELRSLLSKELNAEEKVILPVWHNIDSNDVMKYSPYLADKFALTTAIGLDELAFKIVAEIRPDIANSQAILHASRNMRSTSKIVNINYKNIYPSEMRHKSIPNYLIIGSKMISSIFYEVSGFEFQDYVFDFARDADYEHEFMLWSAMACTYTEFINKKRIDATKLNVKRDVYSFLLDYVNGIMKNTEDYCRKYNNLTIKECNELLIMFAINHDQMIELFSKSMQQRYKKILSDQ